DKHDRRALVALAEHQYAVLAYIYLFEEVRALLVQTMHRRRHFIPVANRSYKQSLSFSSSIRMNSVPRSVAHYYRAGNILGQSLEYFLKIDAQPSVKVHYNCKQKHNRKRARRGRDEIRHRGRDFPSEYLALALCVQRYHL
ncbi:MAG: hypothetical protein LBV52_06225, partial [Spirochaetaceae bacterium]|nr:hypothetical protein [Spirochaetaceae bacterium]